MAVGIPGTGISCQTRLTSSARKRAASTSRRSGVGWILITGFAIVVGLASLGGGGSQSPASVAATGLAAIVPPAAADEEAQPERETVEIGEPANLRAAPRSDAAVVGLASRKERYGVFDRSGAWTRSGRAAPLGWIGNSHLALLPR